MCLFLETSVINPKEKFMQLVSENITCNQFLSLKEVCTYTVDPEDEKKTLFKQEMQITAHVWGAASQIESMGAENFKKNAMGGRSIMMNAVSLIPAAVMGKVFDPRGARAKEEKVDALQ
jgi:hypothetical protein